MNSIAGLHTDSPPANPPAILSWRRRLLAALIGCACLTVLILAVRVDPSPGGTGSHTQLGLPQCGYLERAGNPCITCGMTTAFALTVRGRLIQAFITQPAGMILACGCSISMLLCFYLFITGKWNKFFTWISDCVLYRYVNTGLVIIIIMLAGWLWTWLRIHHFHP